MQNGNQAADDVGIAVGGEGEDAVIDLRIHPYAGGAALHQIRLGLKAVIHRGQLAPHIDQIPIPILPIIKQGEIVYQGL